jgi:SRSO17 transposase
VERLAQSLGHANRREPLRGYLTGLVLPGARKSVEPMAALLAPQRVRQTTNRCITWWPMLRGRMKQSSRRSGSMPWRRWHSTVPLRPGSSTTPACPRKGNTRSGWPRQYCGQLGKQDNCQVAVTLPLAHDTASLPIAYQLYLPEVWASDRRQRRRAGVPEEQGFFTKPEIAMRQISAAGAQGVPVCQQSCETPPWNTEEQWNEYRIG